MAIRLYQIPTPCTPIIKLISVWAIISHAWLADHLRNSRTPSTSHHPISYPIYFITISSLICIVHTHIITCPTRICPIIRVFILVSICREYTVTTRWAGCFIMSILILMTFWHLVWPSPCDGRIICPTCTSSRAIPGDKSSLGPRSTLV